MTTCYLCNQEITYEEKDEYHYVKDGLFVHDACQENAEFEAKGSQK